MSSAHIMTNKLRSKPSIYNRSHSWHNIFIFNIILCIFEVQICYALVSKITFLDWLYT